MQPMNRTHAAPRTPLAPRGGGVSTPQRRRPQGWLGWVAGTVVMLAVGLAAPPPAAACSFLNPVCWVEAGLDYAWDTVKGVVELTADVITLDFDEAFEDLQEVVYNQICRPGLTLLSLAVTNGLEADFDDSCSPPHPIEPAVLAELQRYITSPLDTVRIHEGCDLDADLIPGYDDSVHRAAITFGEHIYFAPGAYHPTDLAGSIDPAGFALLAHELTHVLQYRQKGFADFTCQYATHCALGLNQSCAIEQSAYDYQALVLDDQQRDGDGVFSPEDNCRDRFNPGQKDTDGDGVGDICTDGGILWRHTNGQPAIWFMDGGTITGEAYPGGPDPTLSWTIQGTGDFDADGQADIVWRHTNGQPAIWFMREGTIVGEAYPGGPDPGLTWTIQRVGDFDGDGHADILWRHVSGQLAIWFKGDIAGAAYPGYHNYPWPVDLAWQVQGVGDFNGDGRADILWRHTNGQPAIWFMDGGIRVGETNPGGQDPSLYWKIQAVGDFDRDGRADILWRAADGTLAIWFRGEMGFESPSYRNIPGPVDLSWQVQGLGDVDYDGRADILWRHSNGQVAIWLMDGAHFVGDVYPLWVDTAWQIKGLLRVLDE